MAMRCHKVHEPVADAAPASLAVIAARLAVTVVAVVVAVGFADAGLLAHGAHLPEASGWTGGRDSTIMCV
ncbi:hypothetical protein Arub01_45150 [Actinomadura rubrobrunea]|uniref:Uncharacterized protein n=1 Tax=Actinomadura rubrobrunea TaxID=115335 RepID=A0A9W6UW29_9ACTN|nr:hypothetical protein Arub01_45150 [Actinomadura rubrobrunea]